MKQGSDVETPDGIGREYAVTLPSIGTLHEPDENRARAEAARQGEGLLIRNQSRYELIEEHGRGGLGVVWKARDRQLDRMVALKEVLPPDAAIRARFVREALVTARLAHPGIVPVYEAGRWASGEPYYVMKLVEGRTLADVAAEKTTLAERLSLLPRLIAVADAIAYAHAQGVLHRDLTPANVILGAYGETVVIDWGLAKDMRVPAADLSSVVPQTTDADSSRVGAVIGTPAF